MSKPFPIIAASKEKTTTGLTLEIEGLCIIAESNIFPKLLKRLTDYKYFIETDRKHVYTRKEIQKLFNNGILDLKNNSPILHEIFYTVHMATCCELLKGVTLNISALTKNNVPVIVKSILEHYKDNYNEIYHRLHTIDAIRTIQALKILGLITRRTQEIHQLSLGAADGIKDIRSIHLIPNFHDANNTTKISSNKIPSNLYKLDVTEDEAEDIIIVDGDPTRKESYEEWNNNEDHNVLAINNDSMDVLKKLPEIMKENHLPLRNLVVILRLEHRMIPSIKDFLGSLRNSIADAADLIITIGSGHSLEDFDGRTSTIRNIFLELTKLGMKPVIIKLHGGGNLEQQFNNPKFGLSGITTYQILHCKLKKKLLERI